MSQELQTLARHYHGELSPRIREYLNNRCVSGAVIDRFLIGWSGWRITVPIYDRTGDFSFFKLLKDPMDPGEGALTLSAPDAGAELYGWEHVREPVQRVIICDGIFGRLVMESLGYAAVASTEPGIFRREWAKALSAIPRVYVCFPRTAEGRALAARIARMIRGARLVSLPPSEGEGGVVDFFLQLGGTRAALDALLAGARPISGRASRRGIRSKNQYVHVQ